MQLYETQSDEELSFAEEAEESEQLPEEGYWRVLIVDDETEIHNVTKMAMADFVFEKKGLEFLSAFSGKEAMKLLRDEKDIAVVLLDVVMESDDSGLKVAKFIREELQNSMVRIILRTGQPGQAPEKKVIVNYDINDYKTKTELTSQKLFTTMVASLRGYRDLQIIERNKKGLENIIDASVSIFEIKSMEKFVYGVLTQIISIFGFGQDSFYCTTATSLNAQNVSWNMMRVVAGTGHYENISGKTVKESLSPNEIKDFEACFKYKKSIYKQNDSLIYFQSKQNTQNIIYVAGSSPLSDIEKGLLEIFCSNCAVAFDNIKLTQDLELTQKEIIFRLGAVAETRSKETGNHVKRVAEYSKILAARMGLDEDEIELLKEASPMHDIGKIGIPDNILNKPDKLEPDEFEIMKTHAKLGHDMLKNSDKPLLIAAATIALHHHEKFNGTGYPAGLAGEDIHIYGRITALADVFDALGSDRCYKKAWELERILELFREQRGKHFDPSLVDIFFDNLDEFLFIRDGLRD